MNHLNFIHLACVLWGATALPSFAGYDLLYARQPYQVIAMGLNCREGPGLNHQVDRVLPQNTSVFPQAIANDVDDSPWFLLEQDCYVRAHSNYLIYKGPGEDPSTMCDSRIEPC